MARIDRRGRGDFARGQARRGGLFPGGVVPEALGLGAAAEAGAALLYAVPAEALA